MTLLFSKKKTFNLITDLMKSNGLIATWIGARRASHDFAWADGSNCKSFISISVVYHIQSL